MEPAGAPRRRLRARGRAHRAVRGARPRPRQLHVGARAQARMSYWLLVRGRGDRPLDAKIDADAISRHSSSKRPSVERGDLAILYAAVWQAPYGVVEVVGDPENDPARARGAWRV